MGCGCGRAIFCAEVVFGGLEDGDEGGCDAEAGVEFFEGVVIDQIELDVFIAPGFAGGGVGLAEEIELCTGGGGGLCGGLLFGWGACALCRAGPRHQQQSSEAH